MTDNKVVETEEHIEVHLSTPSKTEPVEDTDSLLKDPTVREKAQKLYVVRGVIKNLKSQVDRIKADIASIDGHFGYKHNRYSEEYNQAMMKRNQLCGLLKGFNEQLIAQQAVATRLTEELRTAKQTNSESAIKSILESL